MKKLSALNNSKFYNSPNIIEKFSFNNWCKFFLTTILLVLKFIHKSFSFPDILLFLKIACKHLFIYKTYLLLTLVTVLPPVGFFLGSMMVLYDDASRFRWYLRIIKILLHKFKTQRCRRRNRHMLFSKTQGFFHFYFLVFLFLN